MQILHHFIWDLSIHGFWYLQGTLQPVSHRHLRMTIQAIDSFSNLANLLKFLFSAYRLITLKIKHTYCISCIWSYLGSVFFTIQLCSLLFLLTQRSFFFFLSLGLWACNNNAQFLRLDFKLHSSWESLYIYFSGCCCSVIKSCLTLWSHGL